jgi:hypothetical protein
MKEGILPPTTKKAAFHTCNKVNQDIRNKTICCINTYKRIHETGGFQNILFPII